MSDYLGRLSERALGVANLVQPAIAPLFAPAPIATVFPTSEDEENDRSRSSTTNEFPRVMASSVVAPINERTVMVRSPVVVNEEEPLAKVNSFPNPSAEADTSNKALQSELSFRSENPHVSQTILAANVESRHPNGSREERPEKRAVPLQFPGIVPSPNPFAADAVPIIDRYLAMMEPVERVEESIEVGPAGRTPLKVAVARITPEAGQQELGAHDAPNVDAQRLMAQLRSLGRVNPTQTERPEQNATSPIVRINIGRIEVRAVHSAAAPAPQPRPEPAHPTVTLTDYLTKKRGAGT